MKRALLERSKSEVLRDHVHVVAAEEECSSIIVFLRVPSLTCLCATTHPFVRSFAPSSSTYTVLLAWGSRQQGAGREGGCRTEESHRRQQRFLSFSLSSMAKLLQCLQCLRLRAAEAAWHCRLQPLPLPLPLPASTAAASMRCMFATIATSSSSAREHRRRQC